MEAWYIAGSILIVSTISLVGVFTLSINKKWIQRSLFALVALAAGAMLGNVLLHLLPEAYVEAENLAAVSFAVIGGFLVFYVLERVLRWQHTHQVDGHDDETPEEHASHIGPLVLVADGVHNILDGFIIAGAYLVSIEVGIATTIAVLLHELPQEIGDFGLLLHAGFSRVRALLWNFVSALTAFAGAAIGLTLAGTLEGSTPYFAAFAAGNLLYIAASDLIPELRRVVDPRRAAVQLGILIAGIAIVAAVAGVGEDAHGHGEELHDEEHETLLYDLEQGHEEVEVH